MPRVIELTVPADRTTEVLEGLSGVDEVLSVRLFRGASLRPSGDLVSFDVLDAGLAAVMRLADEVDR